MSSAMLDKVQQNEIPEDEENANHLVFLRRKIPASLVLLCQWPTSSLPPTLKSRLFLF